MPEEEIKPILHRRRSRSAVRVFSLLVLAGAATWFWADYAREPVQANGPDPAHSVLHLDPFVLNLADSDQRSYLRVGIDLALNQDAEHADKNVPVAEVRDTILSVLGEAKVSELLRPGGKTELKHQVLHALQDRAPALGVEEVYFTEFLIQR